LGKVQPRASWTYRTAALESGGEDEFGWEMYVGREARVDSVPVGVPVHEKWRRQQGGKVFEDMAADG